MNSTCIPKESGIPREIKRTGVDGLRITWADGAVQDISSAKLRQLCPCAGCREQRGDGSHAQPLTPKKISLRIVQNSLKEELQLTEIWAVGGYALGIRWGDGHSSGIYTFQYLRSL